MKAMRVIVWVGLIGIAVVGMALLCQPLKAECIQGDVDGNGRVDIADAYYLVRYVVGGGTAPVSCEPIDTTVNVITVGWCSIDSVTLWFTLPGARRGPSYADSIMILRTYDNAIWEVTDDSLVWRSAGIVDSVLVAVPEELMGGDTMRVRVRQDWPNEWNRWEVWWTNDWLRGVWVELVDYGVEQRVSVEKRKR